MDYVKAQDVVVSIGNEQITGKDCIVKSMQINMPVKEPEFGMCIGHATNSAPADGIVEVEISLVCSHNSFTAECWDDDFKPKIRDKKVEDCSIQELLFAVRQKAKNN